MRPAPLCLALFALSATPLAAKENLGIFDGWAAFRDPAIPRCYAIAMAEPSAKRSDYQAYAAIGTWPRRDLRNQFHLRLSRKLAADRAITLQLNGRRFTLSGGGGDAWAQERRMDAAIVAALRSANTMTVHATDDRGNRFSNSYDLKGAATAIDAATLACARLGR